MSLRIIGPIEAFKDWWGDRTQVRRTNGSPARTQALALLFAIQSDAEALAKQTGNDDLKVPELGKLADYLTEAWAGEGGWDTAQGIRGIHAATAVRQNDMAKADPNEV